MDSSYLTRVYNYDVFLSFRGEDTRKNFTDYLYTALLQEGYRTFRDDEEIEKGESLGTELVNAIKGSKISIIVFSKNYASSPWCLDEVVMILTCKNTLGHLVLPVFYDIRPSEIRKQKGRTGKAFDGYKLEYDSEVDTAKKMKLAEKIKGWKEALEQVADMAGMELKNQADSHEAKFVKKIIKVVENKLSPVKLDVARYEIGIEFRAKKINMWLQDQVEVVGALGICGMGGIGKTTIAKHIYNQNHRLFDGSCFLANVKEMCEQPNGIVGLQSQLLSDVLKRKQKEINNVHEGITRIKNALRGKRVLLVFDDVDQNDHLYAVHGVKEELSPGSKIIITTRNEKLLKPHEVYRLEELNSEESAKLFSLHAFGQECPPESHKKHMEIIIRICGGLPLALQVLGSSLSHTGEDKWVNELEKLQSIPHNRIHEKLKISYESLQDDHDKRLFLDIACFFLGEDKDEIVSKLEHCDLYATVGIENLANRCLLTVDSNNKLSMHQLIRDMGREIVRQESVDEPGERSRLWLPKDCYYVLKNKTGTRKIKGLTIDMHMLKDIDALKSKKWKYEELSDTSIAFSYANAKMKLWKLFSHTPSPNEVELYIDAFHEMKNLRFLNLGYVHLIGSSYNHFPKNLRWLSWHGFPLKLVPTELSLENLTILDMSYSNFGQVWKGPKLLGSLRILNLSYCKRLTLVPNLSCSRNLERVILKGCWSLVKICESIEFLGELILLDLEYCKKLTTLPRNIHMLRSLETLIISGCFSLVEFPTNMRSMLSLKVICSDNMTRINRELYLTSLPGSLVELSLVSCALYEHSFPSAFGNLALLKKLDISDNVFVTLPDSVKCLTNLTSLTIRMSKLLRSILGLPCNVVHLDIESCDYVKKLSFQSTHTQIAEVRTLYCEDIDEIEGVFKIEPLESVHPKIIALMGIDSELIENIEVPFRELYCITRMRPVQVLHEFGIFSTFIPAELAPSFNKCKGSSVSLTMPWFPDNKIPYLKVLAVYCGFEQPDLIMEIYNVTKNLTWIYFPICYAYSRRCEDIAWISLWNFENQLESGDDVTVSVVAGELCEVTECGISVVYEENDGEESHRTSFIADEFLGGNLSNYEISKGSYLLSRYNIAGIDFESSKGAYLLSRYDIPGLDYESYMDSIIAQGRIVKRNVRCRLIHTEQCRADFYTTWSMRRLKRGGEILGQWREEEYPTLLSGEEKGEPDDSALDFHSAEENLDED